MKSSSAFGGGVSCDAGLTGAAVSAAATSVVGPDADADAIMGSGVAARTAATVGEISCAAACECACSRRFDMGRVSSNKPAPDAKASDYETATKNETAAEKTAVRILRSHSS